MRCDECGAEIAGDETCIDRFHALLAAEVDQKAASGAIMPNWVIANPVQGELTIADIDLTATAGQADQILNWARSVAECRCLRR
jgi:hypothetical protein